MLYSFRIFLASFSPKIIFQKLINRVFNIKIPQIKQWQIYFQNKTGLEIGGPSAVFNPSGYLPLYHIINGLDCVNFSNATIWEGNLKAGNNFRYYNKTGIQYIAEGASLPEISANYYDFILSSNNLEHIANPLAALFEWKRIIKDKGLILLILPNKNSNFDHKRPYTNFNHILDDYESKVGEDDLTHLEEILNLHDLKRDPQARPYSYFKERCLHNSINRCIHHHVFDETLIKKMISYCGLELKHLHVTDTCYYILALK